MNTRKLANLFDKIRNPRHYRAIPFKFRSIRCEAVTLDGQPIPERCIIPVSHKTCYGGRGNRPYVGRNGKPQAMARVAWELAVGPIPEGYEVDHKCRNPACVNPSHLQALSPKAHRAKTKAEKIILTEVDEDREAAIVLIQLEPGITRAELAKEFGVSPQKAGTWRKELNKRMRAFETI